MVSPDDISNVQWLSLWEAVGPGLEGELATEVGPRHVLYGYPAVSVARRVDKDDVLFILPKGPSALAVVHLTWSGSRERDVHLPAVTLYSSLHDWLENGMRLDHLVYEKA